MGLLEILATESWNPSMLYANVMRLSGVAALSISWAISPPNMSTV